MARFEREPSEFIEKVVCTNRVSKTVKGGRVMKSVSYTHLTLPTICSV